MADICDDITIPEPPHPNRKPRRCLPPATAALLPEPGGCDVIRLEGAGTPLYPTGCTVLTDDTDCGAGAPGVYVVFYEPDATFSAVPLRAGHDGALWICGRVVARLDPETWEVMPAEAIAA